MLEVIAVLLALQLIAGRDAIGLPNRWLQLELGGTKQERLLATLLRMIRRLERIVFGALVIVGCTAAFVAPPFTGLDTLPALAVVLRLGEERGPDDAAEREQRADQQRHPDCVARSDHDPQAIMKRSTWMCASGTPMASSICSAASIIGTGPQTK